MRGSGDEKTTTDYLSSQMGHLYLDSAESQTPQMRDMVVVGALCNVMLRRMVGPSMMSGVRARVMRRPRRIKSRVMQPANPGATISKRLTSRLLSSTPSCHQESHVDTEISQLAGPGLATAATDVFVMFLPAASTAPPGDVDAP